MENYIPISFLNDFIFCPRSIYYHQLYNCFEQSTYQQKPQIAGKEAHKSIDEGTYSGRKDVFMNYEIYVEKYKLFGKIDIFDCKTGVLTERKRAITTIYDGYVFQVYAHYFGLSELGYEVKKIRFHDLTANKNYPVPLPSENPTMLARFEKLIADINNFNLDTTPMDVTPEKCKNCIYSSLCDKALC